MCSQISHTYKKDNKCLKTIFNLNIIGDRILMVDSIKLEGFTHKQAVQTLCEAPPFCKLVIERGVIIPSRPASTGSRMSQRSESELKAISMQVKRLRDEPGTTGASGSSTDDINVLEMSATAGTGDFRAGQVESDVIVSVEEMQIDQDLGQEQRNLVMAINQLYKTFVTEGENIWGLILRSFFLFKK